MYLANGARMIKRGFHGPGGATLRGSDFSAGRVSAGEGEHRETQESQSLELHLRILLIRESKSRRVLTGSETKVRTDSISGSYSVAYWRSESQLASSLVRLSRLPTLAMPCPHVSGRRFVATSAAVFVPFLATGLSGLSLASPLPPTGGDLPSADATLRRVEDKLGNVEKRYDKLLKEVRDAVGDALETTTWGDPQRGTPLTSHPHIDLVQRLHGEAAERCSQRKNPPETVELLEKYEWLKLLELPRGLEFGTDRPIPANKSGFIQLDTPDGPLPGYPELHVNHYLWGTGEIAGWQTGVKKGKAQFLGRSKKDTVSPCEELPSHEAIRVYLTGNVPETPLLAIPELQHRIHSELAARRVDAEGKRHSMDELLAFLESKWNGFIFKPTYSKKDLVITVPLHALMADMKSLPYHFANSDAMKAVGDIPFTAIQTHVEYSEIFRGESVTTGDLISVNAKGKACLDDFNRDTVFLSRYKALVDVMARSLLSPEIPLPQYLSAYDYPTVERHAPPSHRTPGFVYDGARRHALLLWAACEKDPVRVAGWLHEHVLSREPNVFPSKQSMPAEMVKEVRAQEQDLLAAVVLVIEKERAAHGDAGPGPFERQFCPYEDYLSVDGDPNANALANSFHHFHAELSTAISVAAHSAVQGKIN